MAIILRSREAVSVLLKHGASLSTKTHSTQDTPLHVAVQYGDDYFCQWLLEQGADSDINTTNSYGDTPLHFAVSAQKNKLRAIIALKWSLFKYTQCVGKNGESDTGSDA